MGVVKNLMVRIVTDASSLVGGMKKAGSATAQATRSVKESVAGMRKSVKSSFGSAQMSVREYAEYVTKTKENHTVAIQDVERLTDKIDGLKSMYGSIQNATAGLDLAKPLQKQREETEKQLEAINSKIELTKNLLANAAGGKSGTNSGQYIKLEHQLKDLINESDTAAEHLRKLDQAAEAVGSDNMGYASANGLKALQAEIGSVERELKTAQAQADKTGRKLKSMGVAPTLKYALRSIGTTAAQAASSGVKRLGSGLKSLVGSALRGITSLTSKLLNIGKNASESTGGLNKMVRSIRNIGVVSLGLRVASGLFGRLRSVISDYVGQNESLNASVTSLKNQMGQALAPAINIVIAAMQKLMPIVTSVANAVNSVFTALFGKVGATTAAITASAEAAGSAADSLGTYGFDQITKVSDNSGGGGTTTNATDTRTQEQSALVQKLTGWIQQLKNAFVAGDWKGLGRIFGGGINSAMDSINSVDVGSKVGTFAQNVFTTLHSTLSNINFAGIGGKVGQLFTAGFQKIDWTQAGQIIGQVMTTLPSIIVGFILNTDWGLVAQSMSQLLTGAFSSIGGWIQSVDWLQLGNSIWNFVTNIDYGSIAKSLFSLLGSAIGALAGTLWGFIDGAVSSIKQYFTEKIEECGGNVAEGLLTGILDGLVNIGTWIKDNIFTPFIEGFKSIFGIHSQSTVMEEQGGFIISGLLNGIKDAWDGITEFFDEALDGLKQKLSTGWTNIKQGANTAWDKVTSTVTDAWEGIKAGVSNAGSKVKTTVSDAWSRVKESVTGELGETKSAAASAWDSIREKTSAAGDTVAGTASTAWSKVKSFISGNLSKANTEAQTVWNNIDSTAAGIGSKIGSTVSSAWGLVKDSIGSNLRTAREFASTVWTAMGGDSETAGTTVKDTVSAAWQTAKGYIADNLNSAKAEAAEIWHTMQTDAATSSSNAANGVQSGFAAMKEKVVTIFSDLWSGVKNWINKLIGGVESMVNFVINGINKMIDAFNKIATVGKSVGLNLTISKINTISLPRLATGGIADGPTAAIIGEAGKEAVLPLENNTGWMDKLVQKIVEVSSGGGTPVTLQIILGGRKITEYFIKDINQITKTTGVCPIKV